MKRDRMKFLLEWFNQENKKPLVIRGARQVGKTWLVRRFAEENRLDLIEINFEKNPEIVSLFSSNEPDQILLNLSAALNKSIDPKKSLLFLDEIQAAPTLLAKLRWFAEDLPELSVIAAGSLLEFLLEAHTFSMPVGRIRYMYLEPLSFEEFLQANNKESLESYLKAYQWEATIPQAIHEQLTTLFKQYILIGGMPAAVFSWISKKSLKEINLVHHDLLATYRDDIAKYRGKIATERLDEVITFIPQRLGEKFVYSKVNPTVQSSSVKNSLDLIVKARVCHRVTGCAANGVPLGAEIQKFLKAIFLDVGLCSAALGLSLDQLTITEDINLINKGGIAEQVVGQILRTISPPYIEPALYYWHREEKGSSAEIDYVIQHGNQIIPIEVKSGSTGSLKSLHLFMGLKNLSIAVRVNSDIPTKTPVELKNHASQTICYTLLSIPFYLLGQLHRLLKE